MSDLVELFKLLVDSGKIINATSMPNIPFPTFGGPIWWNELAEYKGWRLQQNMITHHCRILDPHNIRRAWGGKDAMKELFEELNKS